MIPSIAVRRRRAPGTTSATGAYGYYPANYVEPITPGTWDSEVLDYDTPMPYVGPKVDPPHPGDPNVYAPVAPHN